MACAVMCEPKNFPCETCDCDPFGRSHDGLLWKIPGTDIASDVCFRRQLTAFSVDMLTLHAHYKNGVLPFAGGLFDQPYTYFRAMTIVDHWMRKDGRP